jgi:hypothetical protein
VREKGDDYEQPASWHLHTPVDQVAEFYNSRPDRTLCDAISFAVLDTRRVGRAFTFDHHFRQYGRIHVLGLKARTGSVSAGSAGDVTEQIPRC